MLMHAKFLGVNKVHYGQCGSGEWGPLQRGWDPGLGGRGVGRDIPQNHLYGYVPPNWVVISGQLIYNGVSIFEKFSRTGYNILNARKKGY